MFTKDKKNIKGNPGKARRMRDCKRLGAVLVICILVILLHEVFFPTQRSRRRGSGHDNNDVAAMKRGDLRHGRNHVSHRKDSLEHRSKIIVYDSLSQEERINLVVSGKVHLVDLRISKSGIQKKESSSYQGVMGVFCELDWSLHKADPSLCKS